MHSKQSKINSQYNYSSILRDLQNTYFATLAVIFGKFQLFQNMGPKQCFQILRQMGIFQINVYADCFGSTLTLTQSVKVKTKQSAQMTFQISKSYDYTHYFFLTIFSLQNWRSCHVLAVTIDNKEQLSKIFLFWLDSLKPIERANVTFSFWFVYKANSCNVPINQFF